MNLCGRDLLQQWNTQINIPPILETNHKLMYVSGKYQSLTIQVVQEKVADT